MKKFITIIFFYIIYFNSTDIIKANQVIYSESFDNPDILNNWNNLLNVGDNRWGVCLDTASPAHWRIADGWLGITLYGTSCTTVISPPNLDLTEVDNYNFSFDWRLDELITMDRNVVFLWHDENNWYGLKQYGSGLHLEKVINGVAWVLPDSQIIYPFENDQIYHFSIAYLDKRSIKVYINDQLIIETQDQLPFLNDYKTIALKTALGGGRSVSFFDNLVVENLGELQGLEDELHTRLEVPVYRQDNPQWAEDEYDHASLWSEKKPTIKRWGCALSSITMILNYYGINQLPSGDQITPQTLNNWLNIQPDGYIGDGLLNWLAVTRLTRKVSELIGTPKLEYSVIAGNLITPTIEQINLLRPTILNIMGHFLVADGYLNDLSDLLISDPIYPYQYFSQHQTDLISTRIFTPSHTDLSYILISTDIDTKIEVSDIDDNEIDTSQIIESLSSHDGEPLDREIKQYKITQIAKPNSQQYKINFSRKDKQAISFELFSYDVEGNVSQNIINNITDINQASYLLDYQKEVVNQSDNENKLDTNLSKIVSWESLINTIVQLKNNDLVEDYICNYLFKIINWAKIERTENQFRYIKLINNYINNIVTNQKIRESLLSDLNYLKDSI